MVKRGSAGQLVEVGKVCSRFEPLMSTVLTASTLARAGSMPKRRAGSPLWTQRQNFRSAVSSRC